MNAEQQQSMGALAGARALVTGGASGIGLTIAQTFFAEGARVAVLDACSTRPESLASDVLYLVADLRNDDDVRSAVTAVLGQFGGLDILVNNAAVGAVGTVETATDDEWALILDVDVVGTARVSRAAWPALRASDRPAIVNIASIAATTGLVERAVYTAAKGAVLALTRAMAADGLADGIRVNAVSPGTADTPWVQRLLAQSDDPAAALTALEARQPHGRLVSADEVAEAVLYLASPRSGSTNGANLAVDGGMGGLRVAPPRTAR